MLNQHNRLLSTSLLVALTAGAFFANACSDSSDGTVNNGGAGGKAGNGGSAGRAGAGGKAGGGGSSGLEVAGSGPDAGAGGDLGLAGATGEAGVSGEGGAGGAPVAAIETYTATLSGVQEVPPVTTTATGAATLSYDPNTSVLSWTLTHNVAGANAAHIHNAAAGESNPTPLIPLAFTSPTTGTAPLTAAQATELRLGHLYVNVHSATNAAGEIRGQILVTGAQLWVAKLKGTEEVPANASAKVGVSSLIVNAAHTAAHYRVTSDIAAPTASHIHTGITGVAGPVKFPFTLVGPTAEGDITTFVAADYTALTQGQFYVNLHSTDFTAGEIRGQLVEPGERIFSSTLTGANEVPPSGSLATGQIQFIVNAAGDTVRYQSVVAGLADAISAHIHVTATSAVLYPLTLVGLNPTGTHAVTAADIIAFNTNLYYANIHSTLKPDGEIRGPIVPH